MSATLSNRRFAVILSVDVAGYSRMMQRAAPALLAALNAIFRGTIRPVVVGANGRVFKLLGDGALIEFRSVHDGVRAAVEIQRAMAQRDPGPAEPIRLRIGLHAGDVLADGQDLFGDPSSTSPTAAGRGRARWRARLGR